MRLQSETIACTNFEAAKVFVNVDVSKVLPKEIEFSKNGEEFMAEFHYPWLPSRCNLCEKMDQTDKVCVMKKREKKQNEGSSNRNLSKDGSEVKKVVVNGVVNQEEEIKGQEACSLETGTKEETNKTEDIEETGRKVETVSIWSLVSPEKKVGNLNRNRHRETL